MTSSHVDNQTYAADLFGGTGATIADLLFAAELNWPAETPDHWFEAAWDTAITNLRKAVAEVLIEFGITGERDIAILQNIADDGFTDRFTTLNDGWMTEGGTA